MEECPGLLTSIEMMIGWTKAWEPAEREVMFLEWSHSDAEPITLYPHAERRLNMFFMHSSNRENQTKCISVSRAVLQYVQSATRGAVDHSRLDVDVAQCGA